MNSKRKGNKGELEILHLFQERGIEAIRNDQMYIGGKGNPDIEARIHDRAFHVEVKRVEKLNVNEAMNQAVNDADDQHTPIVIHRRNRGVWLVTMKLDDFLQG